MRTVSLTIDAGNQSESVKVFKAIRTLDQTLEMGPTLAKLRTSEEVLSIETDCREWDQRLNAILDLITLLDGHGIAHSMTMVELSPAPIGGGRPVRNTRTITRADIETALEFERSIEVTELPRRVLDLIQEVRNAEWFASVGTPPGDASVLSGTFEEAQNEQPLFAEASLEYRNVLSTTLCYNFPYHFSRCWNEVVHLLRPVLNDLMIEKLKDTPGPISSYLKASICATIRSACVEHFFAPQVPVSTHSSWVDWLVRGHIPYGWDGDFANGRLIVA